MTHCKTFLNSVACILLGGLSVCRDLRAAASELPLVKAPRWEMHEFAAKGQTGVGNPFRDATWVGQFVSPSGRTNVVNGFYDGDQTWRLRFAPDELGEWNYRLRGEGVEISQHGKLLCTAPRGHGFIRIHPENPYAFAYGDGTPFFPMGDTCYGLYDDSPITPELRAQYLTARRARHFNFVRMSVGHSEGRAATNNAYWAWGGSSRQPDLDRLNPVFFRGLDELFRDLKTRGMNVELLLLNFYRRPFTDTNAWTASRERLWLRYVVARYAAFDNVFLWTLANEYETRPDGVYRLDFPSDVDWAKATARFIKANDPYGHLVTTHPVVSATRRGTTPRAPFDPPWRIGEFYGDDDALDVLSQQTGAQGEGTVWDETLQCWTGDSTTLVASLSADRRYRKPVLNSENGYEYRRGHPTEKQQVHHTDKVRRAAWRIVCAGGYFAAGFNGTIGHSDIWNRIDRPNHYTFIVKDEGAAAHLSTLYQFFTALPFWRMQPMTNVNGNAVVLAEPGSTYAAYFPLGGTATLDLPNAQTPLTAQWFNPRSGTFEPHATPITNHHHTFHAPDTNDWALLLTLAKRAAPPLRTGNPTQTTAHLRGLCAVDRDIVWASGTEGTFLITTNGGDTWRVGKVPEAGELDFRDVEALDNQTAWLLSSGNGGQSRIYKTTDAGQQWTLQFQNEKPDAFFDALAFWDARHGIALSDPVDGRFLIVTTTNGGATWAPLNAALPAALPNETAFAASGTCLVVQGQSNAWFGTGGAVRARVFRSTDRGRTWSVSDTPVLAGAESAGIFSLAFRDERNGVAVGGDHKKPEAAERNYAVTHDGGATWDARDSRFPRGFRSAVSWVRADDQWWLVAVGTSGSDVLKGAGPWHKLDNENYNTLSVARFDPNAVWAAGPTGRIARLLHYDP